MKKKTLAIPIRTTDFSDTSQVVSFLTRDFGVVDGIAKGAYREKSPFQGPFDLATLVEIIFLQRSPNQSLAIIAEGTHLSGYRGIRASWDRHVAAAYVIEFLRLVGLPADPVPELFDLALATLAVVESSTAQGALVDALGRFEVSAFRALGLSAEISRCGGCGRPWAQQDRPVYFCPEVVGILCPKCRDAPRLRRQGRTVPGRLVRRVNTLAWRPADNPTRGKSLNSSDRREFRRMLGELRETLLERELRMAAYTAQYS